jgi:hypothetical protein
VNGYTEAGKIYQPMTAVEDTFSRYAKAAQPAEYSREIGVLIIKLYEIILPKPIIFFTVD